MWRYLSTNTVTSSYRRNKEKEETSSIANIALYYIDSHKRLNMSGLKVQSKK